MPEALRLHPGDNVAVAVAELPAGATVRVGPPPGEPGFEVVTAEPVPFGHKIALADLAPGDEVTKYGAVIGRATAAVRRGEVVGVHNIEGLRGRGDLAAGGS